MDNDRDPFGADNPYKTVYVAELIQKIDKLLSNPRLKDRDMQLSEERLRHKLSLYEKELKSRRRKLCETA